MSLPLYEQDPRNGLPPRGSLWPLITASLLGWIIAAWLYGLVVAPLLDLLLPLARVLPR